MSNLDVVNSFLAPGARQMASLLDQKDASIAGLNTTVKAQASTIADLQAQIGGPVTPPPPPPPPPPVQTGSLPAGAKLVLENMTEVSPGVYRSTNLQSLKIATVQITTADDLKDGQTAVLSFTRKTNVDNAAYQDDNWKTMRAGVRGMNYNLPNIYVGHTPNEGADQLTVEHTAGKSGNGTYGYFSNPVKKDVAQTEVYTFKKNGANSTATYTKDGSVIASYTVDFSACPLALYIAQSVGANTVTLPSGAYVEFGALNLKIS